MPDRTPGSPHLGRLPKLWRLIHTA
jgi:hypothetical protein